MTHSRDFGPLAGEMRSALERYEKDELIDLMTHIVRVYVLEENAPITPDVQQPRAPQDLGRLSFPQLLTHLQMVLGLDELDRFRVAGSTVFVTIGENEFQLDGPSPTLPPDAVAAQAGGAPSIADAEASQDSPPLAPAVEASAAAAGTGHEDAPPKAPVTGDADFEIDDALDDHRAALRKAREEAGLPAEKPKPQPVQPKRRRRTSRMDNLFGGGGSSDGLASGLSMRPPPPPPPIADRAPGDPSPDEQREARAQPGSSAASDEPAAPGERRAGFEEPPPLAEGDREIKSSNRFADLELD